MHKHLAVAALATLAAGAAVAQNVEIYGRFNVTAERQKSGDETMKVLQNNASRIGFRGTEDLGGGLKAGFVLEHGFNVDTGMQSQPGFWKRQSEVNLGSASWGLVRLGNFTSEAYYATADYVSMHNHDTGTSADALYAYLGRDINKIAYRLPTLAAGLQLEGAVTAAEGAPGQKRGYDLAANYDRGPLHLGFGYEKNNDARQFALRALYELGALTVGGYVQRDDDAWGPNSGKRNNLRLSAMYTMGADELHFNIGRAGDIGDLADSGATQWTLGVNHNLSKRTKVYGFYTRINNQQNAAYGVSAAGDDFSSFALGVRHNF